MIGLFSFDGPMYRDSNGVYCNTTITSEMLSRYFHVVDELILVIRTFHLDKTYKEANLNKVDLKGIKIIEIPNINSFKGMLFDKKEYKRQIETQVDKADMIFARMPSVISDITIDLARQKKKKYMVEVGGCAWDAFWNHGIKGKLVAPLMFYNEYIGVKNASYATYVTEKWLQQRYPCKRPNIPASNVYLNPLDDNVYKQRMIKLRKRNFKDPIIIGTTAAIDVRYKGQEYIIKAISKLNKQGYNFEYELVGGGNKSRLKKIAKNLGVEDKVRFKGVLLNKDVISWLDSIDIYAQPSKQEGLPRAMIEALSRACPAIGSTTAGIPELIQEDMVFRKGDTNDICKILKRISYMNLEWIASRNFNKAKEFELIKLDSNRKKIYEAYKEDVLASFSKRN
ncbi:glycosyltransferase family 4 protein [Bacillus sp. SB49]|uniref:glycosyltransferase n=1 Tax=Bacillus sp. SB49 TaxID=1071080 RepID=UPI00040ED3FD|nr:glycosyltransferase [Bacillus sp. SB49]QHT48024.1 glycosyltransferase family 4 protein [Bacillus sp. SB49]